MNNNEIVQVIFDESIRKGAEKIIAANVDAHQMYSSSDGPNAYISGYSKGLADGVKMAIDIFSSTAKVHKDDLNAYAVKGVSN